MSRGFALNGVHHVAYRCRDAARTVAFYERVLGMTFTLAIAEDKVPSTGEPDPYMHVFLDAGGGNVLAFFELPNSPDMGRDPATPVWVQHIAFRVDSRQALLAGRHAALEEGLEVIGPVDHGLFESIYFFDPDGHRLELAWDKATSEQKTRATAVAREMLAEWSVTRRAPRHTAWLHSGDAG